MLQTLMAVWFPSRHQEQHHWTDAGEDSMMMQLPERSPWTGRALGIVFLLPSEGVTVRRRPGESMGSGRPPYRHLAVSMAVASSAESAIGPAPSRQTSRQWILSFGPLEQLSRCSDHQRKGNIPFAMPYSHN